MSVNYQLRLNICWCIFGYVKIECKIKVRFGLEVTKSSNINCTGRLLKKSCKTFVKKSSGSLPDPIIKQLCKIHFLKLKRNLQSI